MNIKETFLKATEYLIPYKMEHMVEYLLPKNIEKDSIGNYFIEIGESKSLFTCHLDSYTKKLTKVNKILYDDGNKVKTDGKTPLGGDDKTGMCIMLNMIENNVPGNYYFFVGEEPTLSGGVYGSRQALSKNPDFFKKMERVIAFDRKGYNSIISKQRGFNCCSKEFVNALSTEFAKFGLEYKDDPTGYYTDSAVFMFTCPEITNLSCGGFNEHKNTEWVDLAFLEKLADVACKIDWESLPVMRDPSKHAPRPKVKVPSRLHNKRSGLFSYSGYMRKTGYDLYKIIKDYMDYYYMVPLNGQKYVDNRNVIFAKTDGSDVRIKIKIKGTQIFMDDKKVGSLDNFERKFDIGFDCKFYKHTDNFISDLKYYSSTYKTDKIPFRDVQIILNGYGNFTLNEFLFNYESNNAIFDEDDFIVDDVNKCLEL